MNIIFENDTFHLHNNEISYIFTIMKNGQLGHLYFGKNIRHRSSFSHLLVERGCVLAPSSIKGDLDFSMETLKQEYPAYGCGDYRMPAYQVECENGSRISDFTYKSHNIYKGKNQLSGLPHIHGNDMMTLEITMHDNVLNCDLILNYSIFEKYSAITRSAKFVNHSNKKIKILSAMSLSVDLYDKDYEMLQLDGAWSRERHIHTRKIESGIQSISSTRGTSSASHNPFIALKRPSTTEVSGEVLGFTLIYSGNFQASAEVDCYDVTRVSIGINPFEFEWNLNPSESFQTPEALVVYSENGLNGMSQNFHDIFRNNLMRGAYKNKVRPILINNWEATYFDFNEESILKIAKRAKELGVELFVLDDGWFGKRNDDTSSLGDWEVNLEKLPNGISGIAKKINELDLKFGLWFEPEMVNENSNLFELHQDWVISTPERKKSYGRNQYVLDFARSEVVDYIYNKMCAVIDNANIEYIKWDMNRNITEAYSVSLTNSTQKEFFHRYILGVYNLYERLTEKFPNILFESCASGGARFDAGMLYYAPQAWTSDDTDAIERLHIQYGTSMLYPLVSMGSHVAAIPNHQVMRNTSIKMRADVAFFGTFGYELDLNKISENEAQQVSKQIEFFKKYRDVIQLGDFYRLKNGDDNYYSWLVVSKDKKTAIFAYYKILATPNPSLKKIKLTGLDSSKEYVCANQKYYGDELMNLGFLTETEFTGLIVADSFNGKLTSGTDKGDFTSQIYVFEQS